MSAIVAAIQRVSAAICSGGGSRSDICSTCAAQQTGSIGAKLCITLELVLVRRL